MLGHSNATGEDSDPAQLHVVIHANSWATSTNPAVNSIYLRILAKNIAQPFRCFGHHVAASDGGVDGGIELVCSASGLLHFG
jgi:hypothetical protein